MRKPNLNSLRMFDAAARHLTFRAAADELNLTQGAVAQQVRKLEAELGHRLFARLPRGLALTDTGRHYHAAVAEALGLIDAATARLAPAPQRVTLSVPPSLAAKWLVPRLADFTRAHPEIDIRTVASEGLADFHRDGIDIAIRQGPAPRDEGVVSRLLAPLDLVAVAAPGLAADLPPAPCLADLATRPLIEDGHAHWQHLLRDAGPPAPARTLRFNQTALAIDAAAQGQGVALAPALLTRDGIAAGQLAALWHKADDGLTGFHLLTPSPGRRSSAPATATRTVADWLLSTARAQ